MLFFSSYTYYRMLLPSLWHAVKFLLKINLMCRGEKLLIRMDTQTERGITKMIHAVWNFAKELKNKNKETIYYSGYIRPPKLVVSLAHFDTTLCNRLVSTLWGKEFVKHEDLVVSVAWNWSHLSHQTFTYLIITGQILRKVVWKVIKIETHINNNSVLICLPLQRISATYNEL